MYDLHTHTYYSDGRFSPQELVQAAVQKGLQGLAITDHDNTRGLREAIPFAKEAGITLIPGIEITTCWPEADLPPEDANVDLLAYGIDLDNREFQGFEAALLNDIHQRIEECCRKLSANGHPLAMQDVFERNPRYGGVMQLVQTLLHKNYARDWKEAIQLTNTVWLTGRETPFTIQTAIEKIHRAGGVAVLAHPSIVRPRGKRMTRDFLASLVDQGLDGIEIFHYRLNREAREYFLHMAHEFSLLVSGGSDLHGWRDGMNDLGSQPVTNEMLAALLQAVHRRQKN